MSLYEKIPFDIEETFSKLSNNELYPEDFTDDEMLLYIGSRIVDIVTKRELGIREVQEEKKEVPIEETFNQEFFLLSVPTIDKIRMSKKYLGKRITGEELLNEWPIEELENHSFLYEEEGKTRALLYMGGNFFYHEDLSPASNLAVSVKEFVVVDKIMSNKFKLGFLFLSLLVGMEEELEVYRYTEKVLPEEDYRIERKCEKIDIEDLRNIPLSKIEEGKFLQKLNY